MFQISKGKDGKWVVDMFDNAHNHEFTMSPNKVIKHRSHAKFHSSEICKSIMSDLGKSGLRPCQIKKVVNNFKTPSENDVTSKQCADILAEQRKHHKGKEFFGVIKHFQEKLLKDRNFYFSVDLFDDGSPRNIFWADGRSRDSYIKFSDVVVFDVTYKTNRFEMPFAPFIGVNHHYQSIIFGGALLENEKQETFESLFNRFLECMFVKPPSAIITDQDKAICNAVQNIFPNTRHHYCSWHMKKHELEHLPFLKSRYNGLHELCCEWVKSTTVEEFETRWEVINGQYNFERNCWIMELYQKRQLWAKVFLKDCFFAGMTTSGRSESIHSFFFDDFVNSKTMLNEFVVQFDKAVEARRKAEEDADFKTIDTKPSLYSVNPIEAKAGKRYTIKMFEVFQKEWIEATNNLSHETITKTSREIQYKVGQVDVEKRYWRNVNFCLSDKLDVTCSCAKFETYGILCKHILYVMKKNNVESLPDHYILPRWTLDPRYKVDQVELQDIQSEDVVSSLILWCLQSKFTKAIEQAKDSPTEIKKLEAILVKFLEEQMIRVKHTESKKRITRF
uniref:protein FAR1-RELATED SEQUENCE 5-like n=1 Tax=Erigeron canadensis TaxID=72917 RepID=UPI001CB8C4C1|nr:protein FAR1-RELATED SEQUENCE 5-like [Erigeron canadensis]